VNPLCDRRLLSHGFGVAYGLIVVLAVALQLWIGPGWLKLPTPAFNLAP
jgi:hypothetical protein